MVNCLQKRQRETTGLKVGDLNNGDVKMSIPEFLRGFAKPKPTPIEKGDTVRHKETGIYCEVLNVYQGLVYGRTENAMLTVGKIDNFEKV